MNYFKKLRNQFFLKVHTSLSWSIPLLCILCSLHSASLAGEAKYDSMMDKKTVPSKLPESAIPVSIPDHWWTSRHDRLLQQAQSTHPDIVFFGDSITAFMNVNLLHKTIGPGAANFGIPGDETQHLLWRLQNGELKFSEPTPRAIVVLIGTNNMTKWGVAPNAPDDTADGKTNKKPKMISVLNCTNEEIYAGVKACLSEIRLELPTTRILLLGILPRDGKPDAPSRQRVKDTNALLKGLADKQHIWYADIGNEMLEQDGTIATAVMADYLHPSKVKGYTKMYSAIKPHLEELLQNN